MAERVWARDITNEEGNRLRRIVRRSSGSVVTWRRAQMVLLSAQGIDVPRIAQVTFTGEDRVRDVLHNFNVDGFDSLYPRYRGGRPPTFTLTQRREINLNTDRLYGHIKPRKRRGEFLGFLRPLRSLYPPGVRIAIVPDNYSPHLSTRKDRRVGRWAVANNVELAYTPTNASWLNRIEGHFAALRYFTLDATDHASHEEQASMIRRYIAWRNRNARDERLRAIVNRANVA